MALVSICTGDIGSELNRWSQSIIMRSIIDGKDYQERVYLHHMKKHPFYRDNVRADGFMERIKKVLDKHIYDIMEGIPEVWLRQIVPKGDSGELRMLIGGRLIEKIDQADNLTARMAILKELPTETEAERRSTALKNRNAFKQKYGLC